MAGRQRRSGPRPHQRTALRQKWRAVFRVRRDRAALDLGEDDGLAAQFAQRKRLVGRYVEYKILRHGTGGENAFYGGGVVGIHWASPQSGETLSSCAPRLAWPASSKTFFTIDWIVSARS